MRIKIYYLLTLVVCITLCTNARFKLTVRSAFREKKKRKTKYGMKIAKRIKNDEDYCTFNK